MGTKKLKSSKKPTVIDLDLCDERQLKLLVMLGLAKKGAKDVPVSLALKAMRMAYGVYATVSVRSLDSQKFGFSVWHAIEPLDLMTADLSDGQYDKNDGIINSWPEAESSALTNSMVWLLKRNISSPKQLKEYAIKQQAKHGHPYSYYPGMDKKKVTKKKSKSS